MRTVRCLAAACGLLLVSAAVAHADSGTATPRHLSLHYEVYVGGMNAVNVRFDAALARTTYEMRLRLATQGFASRLFDWKMTAESHGRLHGSEVVPVRAGGDSVWRGTARSTRLSYGPKGAIFVETRPAGGNDDNPPVPPALREGTRDLAGAIFSTLLGIGETGNCNAREQVFDARRRYDLVFEEIGMDTLRSSAYSPYSGPAMMCRVSVELIAGGRKGGGDRRFSTENVATVWIARLFDDTPPVPVRLDYELVVGTMTAHLSAATLDGPGPVQRLAARQ
jgi:hypothetical protein